ARRGAGRTDPSSFRPATRASRSSCDRWQDLELVGRLERCLGIDLLAVAEDVHVAPDGSVLVQDPTGRPGPLRLERAQHLADGGAVDLQAVVAPRQVLQRSTKGHDRHPPSLTLVADISYPVCGGLPYSKCIPSGVRNLPPQMNPQRSKIFTIRGSIVGVAP